MNTAPMMPDSGCRSTRDIGRLVAEMSVTEVAERLGVTRQTLSALLNGPAGVSAEMALRLEGALGTSAEKWGKMQAGRL